MQFDSTLPIWLQLVTEFSRRIVVGRTGDDAGPDVAQEGQDEFLHGATLAGAPERQPTGRRALPGDGRGAYRTSSARKSLTLVSVGPVRIRLSVASNRL